jgi:tetratricopeptide (TPR) repeat protein
VKKVARDVIGREREFASLHRFLEALPAGPRALLIEGDPGIGKTTAWLEGVQIAAGRGSIVLSSRASPAETRLSYSAFGDLLDGVVDEILTRLPQPQARALACATLRREPEGRAPDQRTVSASFLSVLRLLSESHPVLVAIDDVQWLDPPSARVVRFAIRRLEKEPVGMLASWRLGAISDDPLGLNDAVIRDRVERVRLGPLSLGAIDRLIKARVEADIPRPLLFKLYETSEGNPFFALELARAISGAVTPLAPGEPLSVPEGLRDLLVGQLGRLPARVRRLLLFAALLAGPTVDVLEQAGGPRSGAALDQAKEAGVLPQEAESVRFTHPLLAAAVFESASAERRRRAHRRLAGIVADSEERALHLALAAGRPDEHVAAILDEAALTARSRGAPDAASDLYEQAVSLTPSGWPNEMLQRRIRAAECRFESGDVLRASRPLEELIAASPAGPLRAEALWQLALIRVHESTLQGAIGLLQQALEESEDGSRLRASIELALSMSVIWAGDLPGGIAHAQAAVDALDDSPEPGLLAAALAIRACGEFLIGRGISSAALGRAATLERSAEHMPVEWRPSFLRGFVLKMTGDIDEARSHFQALRDRLQQLGDEVSMPFLLGHMSELETWAGDLARALSYANEACEIAERNQQPIMLAAAVYSKGLAHAHAGRLAAARSAGEQSLATALCLGVVPVIQFASSLLGFIALSEGDPAEADRRLRPIAELLAAAGLGEPDVFRFMPDEIEALIELGDLDRAAELLEPFERRAEELGRRWATSAAARCRGLLAAAHGDLPGAAVSMERALDAFDGLPLPFDLGRILLAKGRVERRTKRWREARASLDEALRIFEGLGAGPWAEKARTELARVGGRPLAPLALTETERRVAELIATGRTTRQVANVLFLTPRGVEANLAKVYRKLGIRSRAELGVRIATMSAPHA